MTEVGSLLEREIERVIPRPFPFDELAGRRDRKRRDQRIGAAVVALVIAVAATTVLARAFHQDTVPADRSGTVLWTRQLSYVEGARPIAVAADASGIYVTGEPADSDFGFIAKLGSDGSDLWSHRLSANGSGLAATPDGVFLTAWRSSEPYGYGFLARYGADGSRVWERRIGSTTGEAMALSIATDGTNLYVSGYLDRPVVHQHRGNGGHTFVSKFAPDGNELWTRSFDAPGFDQGQVAQSGQMLYLVQTGPHVAGAATGSDDGSLLVAMDLNGNELWSRAFSSEAGSLDAGSLVARDEEAYLSAGSQLYAVDRQGHTLWARPIKSGPITTVGDGLVVTKAANEGYTRGPYGHYFGDFVVEGVDMRGSLEWTRLFNSSGPHSNDFAYAISSFGDSVFVVGTAEGTLPGVVDASGPYEPFVMRINAT